MYTANRYLVWWESSLTGEHYETAHSPEVANARLEKRKQREHFIRGVVVDMDDATMDADEFQQVHEDFASSVA